MSRQAFVTVIAIYLGPVSSPPSTQLTSASVVRSEDAKWVDMIFHWAMIVMAIFVSVYHGKTLQSNRTERLQMIQSKHSSLETI